MLTFSVIFSGRRPRKASWHLPQPDVASDRLGNSDQIPTVSGLAGSNLPILDRSRFKIPPRPAFEGRRARFTFFKATWLDTVDWPCQRFVRKR